MNPAVLRGELPGRFMEQSDAVLTMHYEISRVTAVSAETDRCEIDRVYRIMISFESAWISNRELNRLHFSAWESVRCRVLSAAPRRQGQTLDVCGCMDRPRSEWDACKPVGWPRATGDRHW